MSEDLIKVAFKIHYAYGGYYIFIPLSEFIFIDEDDTHIILKKVKTKEQKDRG